CESLAAWRAFFTPKALHSAAQGRASAPWEESSFHLHLPRRGWTGAVCFVQPLRGRSWGGVGFPRVRCATLGCGMQRLRRKEGEPGCREFGKVVPQFVSRKRRTESRSLTTRGRRSG